MVNLCYITFEFKENLRKAGDYRARNGTFIACPGTFFLN
tara:strand:- start:277 stop:393 length:117 start_codon:yes stop_codon:yes gene_type:complete